MKELEQNIKNQLEERRINPSENAWKQIAQEVQNSPSKKRGYIPWLAAASILLVSALIIKLTLSNQTTINNESIKEDNFAIENTEKAQLNNEPMATNELENTEVTIQTENKKSIVEKSELFKKENKTYTFAKQEQNALLEKPIQKVENQTIIVQEKLATPPKDKVRIKTSETTLMAVNTLTQNSDTIKKKRIKINRDKLLFSVENEEVVKKSKKIAFVDNTLKIDLNN